MSDSSRWSDHAVEQSIGRFLQIGVMLAAGVVLLGADERSSAGAAACDSFARARSVVAMPGRMETLDDWRRLGEALPSDAEYVVVLGEPWRPQGEAWLWEAIKWFELQPDTAIVGGRLLIGVEVTQAAQRVDHVLQLGGAGLDAELLLRPLHQAGDVRPTTVAAELDQPAAVVLTRTMYVPAAEAEHHDEAIAAEHGEIADRPVTGRPPERPRTDGNPTDRDAYLLHLSGRGANA